jgi:hypothetical protein
MVPIRAICGQAPRFPPGSFQVPRNFPVVAPILAWLVAPRQPASRAIETGGFGPTSSGGDVPRAGAV